MTNKELTKYVTTLMDVVDEFPLDASYKIAALEAAAETIKRNVSAEVMRAAILNALRPS